MNQHDPHHDGAASKLAAPIDDLYHESLLIIAGIIAVIAIGIWTETIDTFYYDVTRITSNGVTWTDVMRQNPWIWPLGTLVTIYLIGAITKLTRRSPRTARLWVTAFALGLGFVGGHVYWPA